MIITVVNRAALAQSLVRHVCAAINKQLREDFAPYWGFGATLRLLPKGATEPDKDTSPMGDGVLYLWDGVPDVNGALGYHDKFARGFPYGFIFTRVSDMIGEPWSVTLSHEALEMCADPQTNLLAAGPHPTENRFVFDWFEMCDAVQAQTYKVGDVAVSNFVLPLYFTPEPEVGSKNDFLGARGPLASLESFSISPGGYIGFFDPEKGEHVTYARAGDPVAKARLKAKASAMTRRAFRIARSEGGLEVPRPASERQHVKLRAIG